MQSILWSLLPSGALTRSLVPAVFTLIVLCPVAGVTSGMSAASHGLGSWTFAPIDVPGASLTYVRDVNQAGQIVGHYEKQGPPFVHRGYLLSRGVFTSIDVGDFDDARGINLQGDIVGDFYNAADGYVPHGFLLRNGGVRQIDYPGADATFAEAVNAAGDVVGYYAMGGIEHGFLLHTGVYSTIDYPGALLTNARGMNTQGEIVGLYQIVDPDGKERFHGFLRGTDGTFATINGPDVLGGNANGINLRGQIVGEYSVPGVPGIFGFLLSGGQYMSISYPGATLTRPWKIAPDGQHIVGFYNDQHGFLLSRKP